MSKLYFKYGCMNSSKSANLLMVKHNYEEQGFRVCLLKSAVDTREGLNASIVKSRTGMKSDCIVVGKNEDLSSYIDLGIVDVVMVDEAQFLSKSQVEELHAISFKVPVLCYGLLSDFTQTLFEGSKRLLELSESLQEIKTVCTCGARASVNARFDRFGYIVTSGSQIQVGGNESYKALCKYCYSKMIASKNQWIEDCNSWGYNTKVLYSISSIFDNFSSLKDTLFDYALIFSDYTDSEDNKLKLIKELSSLFYYLEYDASEEDYKNYNLLVTLLKDVLGVEQFFRFKLCLSNIYLHVSNRC